MKKITSVKLAFPLSLLLLAGPAFAIGNGGGGNRPQRCTPSQEVNRVAPVASTLSGIDVLLTARQRHCVALFDGYEYVEEGAYLNLASIGGRLPPLDRMKVETRAKLADGSVRSEVVHYPQPFIERDSGQIRLMAHDSLKEFAFGRENFLELTFVLLINGEVAGTVTLK